MLFKKIEDIQRVLPVSVNSDLDRLAPHCNQMEVDYIIPLIGQEIYAEMLAFYMDDDNVFPEDLNEDTDKLMWNKILAAQNAIIHLAYWRGFAVLNAYISDGGFKRQESEKVKSLLKSQEDDLKEYFKTTGFNALEQLIETVEAGMITPESKDNPFYKSWHDDFINSAKVFDGLYFIGGSRLIFLRLKKYMQQVKVLHLSKVIGTVNYLFVLSEIGKEDPAEKVLPVLPFIKNALAFLSVAMLMEETGCDLTDKGLVYEGNVTQNGGNVAQLPSEKERVNNLIARNRKLGEAYLNELKQYLIDHAADWDNYSAPKNGVVSRDNTGKKTFWS